MKTQKLYEYDLKILKESHYKYILGIDEAGRGPLAGPVVISGVVLNYETFINGINDSKKVSSKDRKNLERVIKRKSIWYDTEVISESVIEDKDILKATLIGMQKIINSYNMLEDTLILIDGSISIPDIDPNQIMAIIGGDCTSAAIASASILAKEGRDRLIHTFSKIYPQYEFDDHKGYGTKRHIELIKKYGTCPIHRNSFCRNILNKEKLDSLEYEEGLF